MPLFEYRCRKCDRHFEELVGPSTVVECPSCASKELEKQLSTFAAGSSTPEAAPMSACGRCGDPRGPGACGMN